MNFNTLSEHEAKKKGTAGKNFVIAGALAAALFNTSCGNTDKNSSEEKKNTIEITATENKAPEQDNLKTAKFQNSEEKLDQNTENNTNEETLSPETLNMLDELDSLHTETLRAEFEESKGKLEESKEKLTKLKAIGKNLKAINKEQTTDFEKLFNDPLINKENLENDPDLRTAFCDAY